MKRIIYGVGFFLVILFLTAGFVLSYQVSQLRERLLSLEETGAQAQRTVSAMGDAKEREFVLERYRDGKLVKEAYRVASYGSKRVVLRQEKEDEDLDFKEDQKGGFLLKVKEGKVAAYREDGQEIFEYTDIPLEALPSQLQEEVLLGKKIENQEELYNFLENYSS